MLQRDYLVRLFAMFFKAIVRSLEKSEQRNPLDAADTLEDAISQATDIDGDVLLSLAPESMASILQVSDTDPRIAGFIAHSLQLESDYLTQAGKDDLAQLRLQQARTLAAAYGIELADEIGDFLNELPEDIRSSFEEQ